MDTLSLHEKTSAFPNHLYRQPHSPVPATLSAQVAHHCQDCGRPLSFEEVGFPLESGHGRCGPCRKRQEAIAEARARFEELASNEHRTAEETAELGECCLTLIEQNIFPKSRMETVRMVLNRLREAADFSSNPHVRGIACRMALLES
jgi:hypothetical protein